MQISGQRRQRNERFAQARSVVRPIAPRNWAFLFLGLLAIAIQSFVVQTHIHNPRVEQRSIAGFALTDGNIAAPATTGQIPSGPRDPYPADQDPANCPLCSELLHAGQFVTPSAIPLALPTMVSFAAPIVRALANAAIVVSYNWRSRAPPSL